MTAPPVNADLEPMRVEVLADGRIAVFMSGGPVYTLLPTEAWQLGRALGTAAEASEGVAVSVQQPRRAVHLTFQLPEDGNL